MRLTHTPIPAQLCSRNTPTPPVLALPPAFCAFYSLLQTGYHAYAALHVDRTTAENLVADTFGHLATHWPTVVARPNPTAHAWQLLTARLAVLTDRRPCPTTASLQDDSVLLHHVLHYPADDIATLTGQEPATITTLLAAAQRRRTAGTGAVEGRPVAVEENCGVA
ncbi:hypothetical protein OHA59_49935 [Streptomyces sp. NBC_01589]|uniref:hypothetical protein n=1 Tax=Streptomyces sp. NBC_01589 TaxID=2975886 RepID=UPI003870E917